MASCRLASAVPLWPARSARSSRITTQPSDAQTIVRGVPTDCGATGRYAPTDPRRRGLITDHLPGCHSLADARTQAARGERDT